MNTGGGKTTVGLLIAKSCINDGCGPAVYLCPDTYLVAQTTSEAKKLGLRYTEDPRAPEFSSGGAILISTVQTLFNGHSKFGVGRELKIEIGTVVIDDAHACLSIIEEQFSLTLLKRKRRLRRIVRFIRRGFEVSIDERCI